MKKYIFLTMSIEGLSGNPRYVNNKCGWLKQQGWIPMVFWSQDKTKVELENVKPFSDVKYIYHELNFFPSWFTIRKRNAIVDSIIKKIGIADEIVIESNKIQLGAWGELIARKINAKHINFVTTEKIKIHNRSTFEFCYSKLQRGEFFNINPAAVKRLFSNFIDIKRPEKYYWSASMGVDVINVPFPTFDDLPTADFTITHFGRTKGYFPYMIKELELFFSNHQDRKFNLFFLGQILEKEKLKSYFSKPNVYVAIHPPVSIIPDQIFKKSDVVIATAGCASLSAKNDGKTISMDVNRMVPLGLLYYTTLDSNTFSGKYINDKSLSGWLEDLLIKRKQYNKMDFRNPVHGFDYQIKYFTKPDGVYVDSTKVCEPISHVDKFLILMTKVGLFRLVDYVYFKKIRK